jgi:hypothetical protein
MLLSRDGYLRLIKVRDGKRTVLAEKAYAWNLEQSYPMSVTLSGSKIDCSIDGQPVFSISDTTEGYENGGIGLVINEGALSTAEIRVSGRRESARMS